MKRLNLFFCLTLFCLSAIRCTSVDSGNPTEWSEDKLNEWFQSGDWKSGWNVTPDPSIDKRALALQIWKNKALWDKAFHFLKSNDLADLKPGKHPIDGDNLFALVAENAVKDLDSTRFEAHQRYADLQYVVAGRELIGLVPLEDAKVLVEYDPKNDIGFWEAKSVKFDMMDATPDRFFVFFPRNAHRPGIINGDSSVKKIVLKLKLDDNQELSKKTAD